MANHPKMVSSNQRRTWADDVSDRWLTTPTSADGHLALTDGVRELEGTCGEKNDANGKVTMEKTRSDME